MRHAHGLASDRGFLREDEHSRVVEIVDSFPMTATSEILKCELA
ncbi:hypothetical protein FHR84_000618 [Actinopolyspora biskrensis]|uniref:Uncharacterized protein n=1 Tax=Actinopolyspora biskrensis TaxID=1470178 RepID=A0A852YPV6_9ACTN|nr:hypothetical protein [Actinopolyspora biskrensis]NYH77304.1 hypothetical protein [Actinopolyspora biskrensis]